MFPNIVPCGLKDLGGDNIDHMLWNTKGTRT